MPRQVENFSQGFGLARKFPQAKLVEPDDTSLGKVRQDRFQSRFCRFVQVHVEVRESDDGLGVRLQVGRQRFPYISLHGLESPELRPRRQAFMNGEQLIQVLLVVGFDRQGADLDNSIAAVLRRSGRKALEGIESYD